MDDSLSNLINQGFFRGGRKIIMSELFKKNGFDCFVKNGEFFLKNNEFSLIISDSTSVLVGNDSCLNKSLKEISKEIYKMVYKGIESKKKLIKNDSFEFINLELNPLIFQCFYDFKTDFSKISEKISKKGINSVFSKNVFSMWNKNTHYSIRLDENYYLSSIDYSVDFYSLKNDDLFIGFPYSVKFLLEPFKGFVYNGRINEFKKMACSLIDELSKEFK